MLHVIILLERELVHLVLVLAWERGLDGQGLGGQEQLVQERDVQALGQH